MIDFKDNKSYANPGINRIEKFFNSKIVELENI